MPFALVVERLWILLLPGWETGASVAGMSFVSTALARMVCFCILGSVGATNSMLVTLLMPVTTLLLSVTVLGESLDPKPKPK